MMLAVMLTSVLANEPPFFSCACDKVAVTLSGDALSAQSRLVGVYTRMQGVTRFDRPVYEMLHPADCSSTQYLFADVSSIETSAGSMEVSLWFVGDDYMESSRGLQSSHFWDEFTCPEDSSPWEFWDWDSTEPSWSSSGEMDVACCTAGCVEDNSTEASCKEQGDGDTGDRVIDPLIIGLFVGIGICLLIGNTVRTFVGLKREVAPGMNAECEGSVTATAIEFRGTPLAELVKRYGDLDSTGMQKLKYDAERATDQRHFDAAHFLNRGLPLCFLEYEFHVPGDQASEFGVKITDRRVVGHQLLLAHATGLPKTCTVRYARANPSRCSQLVKVGDDDRPSRDPCVGDDVTSCEKRSGYVIVTIFAVAWIGGFLALGSQSWSQWEPAVFFAVVGILTVLAIVFSMRYYYYVYSPLPVNVTKLNAPYQGPQPAPQPRDNVAYLQALEDLVVSLNEGRQGKDRADNFFPDDLNITNDAQKRRQLFSGSADDFFRAACKTIAAQLSAAPAPVAVHAALELEHLQGYPNRVEH